MVVDPRAAALNMREDVGRHLFEPVFQLGIGMLTPLGSKYWSNHLTILPISPKKALSFYPPPAKQNLKAMVRRFCFIEDVLPRYFISALHRREETVLTNKVGQPMFPALGATAS